MEENNNAMQKAIQRYKRDLGIFKKDVYKVRPPEQPTEESLKWYRLVGPVVFQLAIVASSAFLLSGSRTGFFFYAIEKVALKYYNIEDVTLAITQAILSVLVTEVLVMAGGFFSGQMDLNILKSNEKKLEDVSPPKSAQNIAYVILLFAGAFSVLPLTGIDDGTVTMLMAFFAVASVVGIIAILHGTSKFLAVAIGIAPMIRKQRLDEYRKAQEEWEAGAASSFTSSRYYHKEVYRTDAAKVVHTNNQEETISKTEQADIFIAKYFEENKKLPTSDVVKNSTDGGKTLGSKRLNYYKVSHSTSLLKIGAITLADLQTAQQKVDGYNKRRQG